MLAFELLGDVSYIFDNCLRGYLVFFVVCNLDSPSTFRLFKRFFKRTRHHVRVEDYSAKNIPRRTANSLYERCFRTKKPLFVSIKNTDECYFRQIKSLTEKVHSHTTIKCSFSKISQNFYSFNGLDIAVKIFCLKP